MIPANCTCPAYEFPHRSGGGDCHACDCPEAPRCHHWIADTDPYATGDWWLTTYESRIEARHQRRINP